MLLIARSEGIRCQTGCCVAAGIHIEAFATCRVCNLWTAAELEVGGKSIPLCKG